MKITNYTLIPRDAKNSPLLSTIFLHLVIWYILDIFCSFRQKRKTLWYRSCELFGNFSNFLENLPTFWEVFKNSKFSKFKIFIYSKFQN